MKRNFYPFINFPKNLSVLFLAFVLLMYGAAANAQTYTITFPLAPPAVGDASMNRNDNPGVDAIETGVRFRVTQPGNVTAILFYKGSSHTGAHIGHLWNNDGTTKLAEETFIETATITTLVQKGIEVYTQAMQRAPQDMDGDNDDSKSQP